MREEGPPIILGMEEWGEGGELPTLARNTGFVILPAPSPLNTHAPVTGFMLTALLSHAVLPPPKNRRTRLSPDS